MALKAATGFEFDGLAASRVGSAVGASIQGVTKYHGLYALKLVNGAAGGAALLSASLIGSADEAFFSFYFRFSATPLNWPHEIFQIEGTASTFCMGLELNRPAADIFLFAMSGADDIIGIGSIPLVANTWYRIEGRVKKSSVYGSSGDGVVQIKVDGVLDIDSSTEDNIRDTVAPSLLNAFKDNGCDTYFDDFVMVNTAGAFMNTWIGDAVVESHTVEADGTYTDFDGNGWQDVDENPPDDGATKVTGNADGEKETYEVAAPTYAFAKRAVIVEHWLDPGGATVATLCRYGGADYDGTAFPVGGAWRWGGSTVYYEDPEDVAWTNASIGNLEIGAKVTTGDESDKIEISGAWVMVIFDPDSPGAGANVGKISGVDWANATKVSGVAEASINEISGVSAN